MNEVQRCGIAMRARLQIDLIGDGEMAIDNLEASSRFLLEAERVELRNRLFVAKRELAEGNSETAIRLLDSQLVSARPVRSGRHFWGS
jgi:hypothetical protein